MSSGGISPGLDFYAVIRISGTLNQQGIHDLMLDIENLMNSRTVNGKILTKARFTEKEGRIAQIDRLLWANRTVIIVLLGNRKLRIQ